MTYTVKPGDSLSKIARDVLGNMDLWQQIADMNNINDPNLIIPGQVLKLPDVMMANAASQSSAPAPLVQQAGMGWTGFLFLVLIAGGIYVGMKKKKKKAK